MAVAPTTSEIFQRAVTEGKRRLDQSFVELISTSFIAGFTVVFGIVGFGIAYHFVEPQLGSAAHLVGALVFGIGLVFLIVGRAELFTENFFDPVATAFERGALNLLPKILRLWLLTFVLNLVGGSLFALVFWVHGVLPPGVDAVLSKVAEEIVGRGLWTGFMSAIAGGALVALLSYMLMGTNSVASRIMMAYLVGFLLALGPFDHVIVTTLHLFFGVMFGTHVGFGEFATIMGIVTVGNLVGGVGLVTLSHVAQAKSAHGTERVG